MSWRETLEGLLSRAGRPEKIAEYEAELAIPPLPPEVAYLWRIFERLSARRGSNGFGANPIGWAEIDAFARLTGATLAPWECEVIEMLDDLFRSEQAKSARPET